MLFGSKDIGVGAKEIIGAGATGIFSEVRVEWLTDTRAGG